MLLIAYRRSAVTSIARGENSGRTLNEANIVRTIRTLGRWNGQVEGFGVRIDSLPADSTDVAVLLQGDRQSSIIGAGTWVLPADRRVERSAQRD